MSGHQRQPSVTPRACSDASTGQDCVAVVRAPRGTSIGELLQSRIEFMVCLSFLYYVQYCEPSALAIRTSF
eukprot:COSAG02_NODE_2050_length_10003_cov_585.950525_4_plen_71_part_00